MLPDPLHPAVVHFPMALAALVPLLAGLALAALRWDLLPARSWAAVVLIQGLLVSSAWLALETGEEEEDRAERFVAERHIEAHEEAAETFAVLAGVALGLSVAGLLPRRLGELARVLTVVATLGVLVSGIRVGHLGGELVYKHGAASAYVENGSTRGKGIRLEEDEEDEDGHD